MRTTLLTFLLLCALTAHSASVDTPGSITDADLEVDANKDGVPDGWRLVDRTLRVDRENVVAGKSSVCVETTGRLCLTRRVAVQPYMTYTLTAQYRVEHLRGGGGATIRTYYFDASGKRIGRHTQGLKPNGDGWRRATLTTRAPCRTAYGVVYAVCAYLDSKVHIDDVCFHAAGPSPRALSAYRVAEPIRVDGDFGEWREPADARPALIGGSAVSAEPHVRGYESFITTIPPLSDMSAVVRAAWDDEWLYFAATVQDDRVCAGVDSLSLALQASQDEAFDVILKATVAADGLTLTADQPLAGCRHAVGRNRRGYTIELSVPVSLLHVKLEEGRRIGYDLALHDSDPMPGDVAPQEKTQFWRSGAEATASFASATCGVLGLREEPDEAHALGEPSKLLATLPPAKAMALKKLYLATSLVAGGRPQATIVVPSGVQYRRLAERVQAGAGVALPIKTEAEIDPIAPGANVIAIGSAMNNRLILYLHGNHYSDVTEGEPGPNRFRIKSIHDPYGTGHNVVLVGASGPDEAAKAVEALVAILPKGRDLVLPRLFITEEGDQLAKSLQIAPDVLAKRRQVVVEAIEGAIAKTGGRGLTARVGAHGFTYNRTGDDAHAWCFRDSAFSLLEYVRKCRDVFTDRDSFMDSTFWQLAVGWDLVEESPVFSDADRHAITNLVWSMAKHCGWMCRKYPAYPHRVIHNHMSFPLLSSFFGARYFEKYYGSEEARKWREVVDLVFGIQAESAQPQSDAGGYSWLVPMHLMQYALARPNLKYFRSGNARGIADLLVTCTDNNGNMSQFGDAGGPASPFRTPIVAMAAWFYRSPGHAWLLDAYERGRDRFHSGLPPRPAAKMVGITAMPMTKPVYDYSRLGFAQDSLPEHLDVPPGDTFHKISFRSSLAPDGQYLLLDGWGRGYHLHEDANTIIRFTQHSKLWLLDCHYTNRSPLYHNGVTVVRDGEGGASPVFARLHEKADFRAFGMTRTSLDDYNGADWGRNIIWRKGDYFVVLDELRAKRDGEFSFQCLWRTMGEGRVEGRSFICEQDDAQFFVKSASALDRQRITCDVFGIAVETGDGPVKKLHQVANRALNAGESYAYANLLYATDDGHKAQRDIRRVSARAVLVRTDQPPGLTLIGRAGAPAGFGALKVAASMFVVEPNGFALSEGTTVSCGRDLFASKTPIAIEMDLRTGRGIVEAGEETEMTIVSGPGPASLDGEPAQARYDGRVATLAIPAGRHVVEISPCPEASNVASAIAEVLGNAWQRAAPDDTLKAKSSDGSRLRKVWSYHFPAGVPSLKVSRAETVRLTSSIPPMERSPWVKSYRIKLKHLVESGKSFACWEPGQVPVITMDIGEPCDVDRIVVRSRWTYCAAKAIQFRLDRLELSGSNDNFQQEAIPLGAIVETKERKGKEDVEYQLTGVSKRIRYLRLKAVPRQGAAVYLYEIQIHRKRRPDETLGAPPRGIKVHQFAVSDIDGDELPEVIVGAANQTVNMLAHDGKLRWSRNLDGSVNAVAAADLDADGTTEIIAGASDERLHVFDREGVKKWERQNRYFFRPGHVLVLEVADTDGDGKQEAVLGTFNSFSHCIDHTGRPKWECQVYHHWTKSLAVADLDLDGRKEAVFGTSYSSINAVDSAGTRIWRYSGGGKFYGSVVAADVIGDEKLEVIAGSKNYMVHCCDHRGQRLWRYNTGGNVNAVAAVDLTGDGKEEIVAGSGSFWLYALTGEGKLIWSTNIGDSVNALAVSDLNGDGRPEIVVGADDNCVHVLSGEGRRLAWYETGGYVNAVGVANVTGDASPEILAASWDGNLYVLKWQ